MEVREEERSRGLVQQEDNSYCTAIFQRRCAASPPGQILYGAIRGAARTGASLQIQSSNSKGYGWRCCALAPSMFLCDSTLDASIAGAKASALWQGLAVRDSSLTYAATAATAVHSFVCLARVWRLVKRLDNSSAARSCPPQDHVRGAQARSQRATANGTRLTYARSRIRLLWPALQRRASVLLSPSDISTLRSYAPHNHLCLHRHATQPGCYAVGPDASRFASDVTRALGLD